MLCVRSKPRSRFARELAAEALRRNEKDTHQSLDNLSNPELNSKIQLHIESRKRKRKDKENEKIISGLVSMGFDRARVVEAVQACGTQVAALNQLSSQAAPNHGESTSTATNTGLDPSNPTPGPDPSLDEENRSDEGTSSPVGSEERDFEMENELAEELDRGDALEDYDIDVTKEAEAINEYLALLDSSSGSAQPSSL